MGEEMIRSSFGGHCPDLWGASMIGGRSDHVLAYCDGTSCVMESVMAWRVLSMPDAQLASGAKWWA